MTTIKKYLQQGDVLIFPDEIPEGLTKSKSNILQYGEANGHAHRLDSGDHEVFFDPAEQDNDGNGPKYLHIVKPTALKHEEHKPIVIPAGKYRIGIVREYDHLSKEIRRVAD